MKNYRDFDCEYTIKIHKEFETIEDYYTRSSSCHDIEKLKVHTLFVNSRDDRFSPVDSINFKPFETNDNIMMLLTESGGHACWFQGQFYPTRWFIKKSIDYVETIHNNLTINSHCE